MASMSNRHTTHDDIQTALANSLDQGSHIDDKKHQSFTVNKHNYAHMHTHIWVCILTPPSPVSSYSACKRHQASLFPLRSCLGLRLGFRVRFWGFVRVMGLGLGLELGF